MNYVESIHFHSLNSISASHVYETKGAEFVEDHKLPFVEVKMNQMSGSPCPLFTMLFHTDNKGLAANERIENKLS